MKDYYPWELKLKNIMFSKLKFTPTDRKTYPVTDMFIQKSLTLPNNPHMTNSEVDEVITKVIKSEY